MTPLQSPVAALMQRGVARVGLDDTVAEIERTLLARGLTWVPVLDGDGMPVGVVSASDLLRFHAAGRDAGATRAWQLCTYKPITVTPDTTVEAVARMMVEHAVHHVAVADAGGLCGVVSTMDVVRACVA